MEYIEPERMIYPANMYDQFNDTVPILGHWSLMPFADIVRKYDLEKDSEEYKILVSIFNGSFTGSAGVIVPVDNTGVFEFKKSAGSAGTAQLCASVYEFQFRYYVDKIVTKSLDDRFEYHEFSTDFATLNPDKKFQILRFERIYKGASVNGQMYLGFGEVNDCAVTQDHMGRIHAKYDYTCTIIKNFGGEKTSFAKVMLGLSMKYDQARWMLFREIRKSRGAAISVNKSFLGKQTKDSVLYDLEDSGYLEYNSNEKFEETGEGILNGNQVIGAVNSGSSSRIVADLISVCMDLERLLDSITGINASRKGTEMATTTATTAQNNLQASRSVTYDLFYFTENHMQRAFTNLIQKTKSALYHGSQEAYSYLPIEDLEYLKNSLDYYKDNFEARIVGGRRSQQIFSELSQIITQEVVGGKRSSADFITIKESKTLREAEEALRASDVQLQSIQQQSEQMANQTKLQLSQQANQTAIQNREDEQAAKKEIQDSINATALQIKNIDAQVKLMSDSLAAQVKINTVTQKTK
jgi:hypothetical protein